MKLTRSGRVRLAMVVWVAVSTMLIWRGFDPYFFAIESAWGRALTLGLAVFIGVAKGVFVITKSATRTAAYIARRPPLDWFWNAFHPLLYVLIPVMIAMGLALRHFFGESMPAIVTGVYVGIGAALLVACRGFARAATSAQPEPRSA